LFGNVTFQTVFMSMVFYIYSFSKAEQVELNCLLSMILCVLVISSDKGLINVAVLLPLADPHSYVILAN
jgi:hypothetical protein